MPGKQNGIAFGHRAIMLKDMSQGNRFPLNQSLVGTPDGFVWSSLRLLRHAQKTLFATSGNASKAGLAK